MNYILVSRKKEECFEFSEKLSSSGFSVLHLPLIERVLNYDLDKFSKLVDKEKAISFVITSNFTFNFFNSFEVVNILSNKKLEFFVLNQDIADKLSNIYVNSKCLVSNVKSGEGVAREVLKQPLKRKVIYAAASKTSGTVESILESKSVEFSIFSIYETHELKLAEKKVEEVILGVDSISLLFFSPSAVRAYLKIHNLVSKLTDIKKVFAIGNTTKRALSNSFSEVIIPKSSDIDSLYDVIVEN